MIIRLDDREKTLVISALFDKKRRLANLKKIHKEPEVLDVDIAIIEGLVGRIFEQSKIQAAPNVHFKHEGKNYIAILEHVGEEIRAILVNTDNDKMDGKELSVIGRDRVEAVSALGLQIEKFLLEKDKGAGLAFPGALLLRINSRRKLLTIQG